MLLLGDPGTAKSQLLKFVEKAAPISIYTSGKGSSAAGLTASVIRDASGDFYLEGGAMVLADKGVVCIDEFDKMNDEDRVAIHEAMEQQTISIAKAGITTILNSRTSVLAAANPIFGRYDDSRAPGENIDFSVTILSRFDMIFIIKDEHNLQKDTDLAKHILSIHMKTEGSQKENVGDVGLATLRQFIHYCRNRCAPRLSDEAARRLSDYYVEMRSDIKSKERVSGEKSSIPITVRQLEAIIRIAESLAKLSLSPVANVQHVEEALQLFRASTLKAVSSGHLSIVSLIVIFVVEGMIGAESTLEIERIEKEVKQRIPIGSSSSYIGVINNLVSLKVKRMHADFFVTNLEFHLAGGSPSHRVNDSSREVGCQEQQKGPLQAEVSRVRVSNRYQVFNQ